MTTSVKTDDVIFNFFKQICDEKDDKKCVELGNQWINAMEVNLSNMEENLEEREKEIINLRFGINNSEVLTLDEIGRRFNLTRERIRQIEKKALKKIEKNYGLSLKGFLN